MERFRAFKDRLYCHTPFRGFIANLRASFFRLSREYTRKGLKCLKIDSGASWSYSRLGSYTILSGNTLARISALTGLVIRYGLPLELYLRVLTSTLDNFPFLRIAKSHDAPGLTLWKTSKLWLNKSIMTRCSDIAPLVFEDNEDCGLA